MANNIEEFDEVLTPMECERLMAWAQPHLHKDFRTSIQDRRTGYKFWHDIQITYKLRKFLADKIKTDMANVEGVEVVRYLSGCSYPTHSDGPWRTHTCLVYLNTYYEGGRTHFPIHNQTIVPKIGRGLIWQNAVAGRPVGDNVHEVQKVDFGVKWVAVCWAWARPVDKAIQSGVNPDG